MALHPQRGSPTCFRLSLLPYSGFFIINCSTRLIQAQCDVLELSEIKEIVVLSVPRTTDPPRTCLVVLTYRIISLEFILLTIGILSGAVWANEAWGSYWNWDPKETWAFITWTVFAIYLHIRTTKNYETVNFAIVASMGFLIIWICYFGVNLLGIGLHSYGSFILPSN